MRFNWFNPLPALDRLTVTKDSREALEALVHVQKREIDRLTLELRRITEERDDARAEYRQLAALL